MATLAVLEGPDKGHTFHALNEVTLLGRESAQVHLTDRTVSRRHAELHSENGDWILQDCRSSNGTYINGIRISKPTRLKHGDEIKIGSTLLVYAGEESRQKLDTSYTSQNLIALNAGGPDVEAAILSAVPNDESIVIAGPEVTQAARAWRVMSDLSAAIGAMIDPDQLLERVMDVICEELPIDHGFILMYDKECDDLVPHVVRTRGGKGEDNAKTTTSRRIIQHVAKHREAVLCGNAMTDDRFARNAGQDSIHHFGLHSVICAPIMVRDELLGIIHIDSAIKAHSYTQEQLRLMSAIGQMTGLAIKNARLVQQQMQTARLAAAGETVAYLSHNIKNILQAFQAGADIVDLGLKKENIATVSQGWGIVRRNIEQIMQMTMNMLSFSKTREPNLHHCSLSKLIGDVVSDLQHKASERRVALRTELQEPFPPVPLDEDGITQAAMNLISNAIEAVAEDTGTVTVSTRFDEDNGIAEFSVSDNGPGIPHNEMEHIFEPFKSTKGYGGTGLGLPVARKIVQEHGGHLLVENTPGKGVTFRARLPIHQASRTSGDTFSNE